MTQRPILLCFLAAPSATAAAIVAYFSCVYCVCYVLYFLACFAFDNLETRINDKVIVTLGGAPRPQVQL